MPSVLESSMITLGLNALSAVGTAAAAGLSAWSAWIARGSARIAQEGVEEARKARKAVLSPRLVLEREFLDFQFFWPHPNGLNGGPVFLARKNYKEDAVLPPSFSISNHGDGPALELQIVFELDDPNGDYTVPGQFAACGLSVNEMPSLNSSPVIKILSYNRPDGKGGVGLPLYKRFTVDLPACAPGQSRKIEFPESLLNRLFLRGLQYWDRRGEQEALQKIILTVRISCYTVDGDPYTTQFRFSAFPFWQGEVNPLKVYGHFDELPMYAREAVRVE